MLPTSTRIQLVLEVRAKAHEMWTLLCFGEYRATSRNIGLFTVQRLTKLLSYAYCTIALLFQHAEEDKPSVIYYIFEILFIFSVAKLLLNAALYDGEIWHADV